MSAPQRFSLAHKYSVLSPGPYDSARAHFTITTSVSPQNQAEVDLLSDLVIALLSGEMRLLRRVPPSREVNRAILQALPRVLGDDVWREIIDGTLETPGTRQNLVIAGLVARTLWEQVIAPSGVRSRMSISADLYQGADQSRSQQIDDVVEIMLRGANNGSVSCDAAGAETAAQDESACAHSFRSIVEDCVPHALQQEADSWSDALEIADVIAQLPHPDTIEIGDVAIDANDYLPDHPLNLATTISIEESSEDVADRTPPASLTMPMHLQHADAFGGELPSIEERKRMFMQAFYEMDALFSHRRAEVLDALARAIETGWNINDVMADWGIATRGDVRFAPPSVALELANELSENPELLAWLTRVGRIAHQISESMTRPQYLEGDPDYGMFGNVQPTDDPIGVLAISPHAFASFVGGHEWRRWQQVQSYIIARGDEVGVEPPPRTRRRGGFICFVDNSGSMSGARSDIAKAIAMAMAQVAAKNRFPYALYLFSSGVDDLHAVTYHPEQDAPIDALRRIIPWASVEPDGGTSFDAPLREALDRIEKWNAAVDAVLVTDGVCAITDTEVEERWRRALQTTDVKLLAVIIGMNSYQSLERLASGAISIRDESFSDGQTARALARFFSGQPPSDRSRRSTR